MKKFFLLFILVTSFLVVKARQTVEGYVFNDKNRNQQFDQGDEPLKGVFVSSLGTIVETDKDGKFELPIGKKDIVFVIKPRGYQFPLQKNNVPAFYKILYQESSPADFKYKGITDTIKEIENVYFPMYPSNEEENFSAQMIGDIQAPTPKEVEFFQQTIVPVLYQHPADFKVCLGDIADNNLDIYPSIVGALNSIKTPLYMVFGNHDTNYRSAGYQNEAETFRSHFGPDYYSFNYGETHFVVLNTVLYNGWNVEDTTRGSYTGGLYPQQLEWLKQDMNLVPDDQAIVLMAHIPFTLKYADSLHIKEVFDVLKDKENLLSIYGHLHQIESWQYNKESMWEYPGQFKAQVAGATCGAWWLGPFNLDSIPDATCTDGAPPGIFLYNFSKGDYSKQFIPASNAKDQQMRIGDPPANISIDSLASHFIYVNVFDGNVNTKVQLSIDSGKELPMQKTIEVDPYMRRNNYLRFNRGGWKPGLDYSRHLWKVAYPEGLTTGKHLIKASCLLEDGRTYSTIKIVEITK